MKNTTLLIHFGLFLLSILLVSTCSESIVPLNNSAIEDSALEKIQTSLSERAEVSARSSNDDTDINLELADGATEVTIFEKDVMLTFRGDHQVTFIFQLEEQHPRGTYEFEESKILFNDRMLFLEDTRKKKFFVLALDYGREDAIASAESPEITKIDLGDNLLQGFDVRTFTAYGAAQYPKAYPHKKEIIKKFKSAYEYIAHLEKNIRANFRVVYSR